MKPVAEALKVGGQSCFGGAIEIVALAAPVPCHGGQGADEPAALFLKVVGNNIQCRDTSGEVGIQDAPCLAKVRLCGILDTNFTGCVSALNVISNHFEK